jgi:hypothetical protein
MCETNASFEGSERPVLAGMPSSLSRHHDHRFDNQNGSDVQDHLHHDHLHDRAGAVESAAGSLAAREVSHSHPHAHAKATGEAVTLNIATRELRPLDVTRPVSPGRRPSRCSSRDERTEPQRACCGSRCPRSYQYQLWKISLALGRSPYSHAIQFRRPLHRESTCCES